MWRLILILSWTLVQANGGDDLTRYVNPLIGTGQGAPDYNMGNAAGNTPPGASFPFGMALWSPDTTNQSGGYRFEHNSIQRFLVDPFFGPWNLLLAGPAVHADSRSGQYFARH